jgi:hypothetical protein
MIIAALSTLSRQILEDLEVPVDGLKQGPVSVFSQVYIPLTINAFTPCIFEV